MAGQVPVAEVPDWYWVAAPLWAGLMAALAFYWGTRHGSGA